MRPGAVQPYGRGSDPDTADASSEPSASSPSALARWGRGIRRRSVLLLWLVLAVMAAVLALLLWWTVRGDEQQIGVAEVNEAVAAAMAAATPAPPIAPQVYQAILPSLAVVQTDRSSRGEGFGVGGGVVINDNAEILTALHVVEGGTEIKVGYADGTTTTAEVASVDPQRDIALLTPHALPSLVLPATIGNPASLRIGDEVYAVGNPLALVASMSAGVVSGLGRDFNPPGRDQTLMDMIQFDAAVNPGNSGGPLLDQGGRVVGIVIGLANPTNQDVFIGLGFAVPIDQAAGTAGGPAQ